MSYTVLEAAPSDIPKLVDLLVLTLGETAMYDVIYAEDPGHSMQKGMHEWRLKGLLDDSKARVFKMVERGTNSSTTIQRYPASLDGQFKQADSGDSGDTNTDEEAGDGRIVGCIALALSQGEIQDGPLGPGTATAEGNALRGLTFPSGMNVPAMELILGGIAQLMDTMRGEHYNISMLGIHPSYRSQRLASRLLSHVLSITDAENQVTWLCSLPGSHELYVRQGFMDRSYEDADLNLVDPLKRGLGLFRHQAMYRPPGGPRGSRS